MRARVVWTCLALAACGGGAPASPASRWRSFDVVATLQVMPPSAGDASFAGFPTMHAFTLAWNSDRREGLVGAEGVVGQAIPASGGPPFRVSGLVGLPVAFAGACGEVARVQFDELTFSITGHALDGTARGRARFQSGDQMLEAAVSATLAGVADATPPRLLGPKSPLDPLAGVRVATSEPIGMPVPDAWPSLVGTTGDVVPLVLADSPGSFVNGFVSDARVLRYGETYALHVEGLADFAGHAAVAAPPTFTTTAAPPLVPEDGFESVTTPKLGGAGVLRGEPLPPLAGTTSVILNTGVGGGFGFLPYMLGPSFVVRLARAPGDTVLRFERRLIATYDLPSARYQGSVRLGAVGHGVVTAAALEASDLQKVTLPRDGDLYVSGVETVSIPLPSDVTDEVVFEIDGTTASCGGVPPPPTALVIDDLRVE